MSSHREAPEVSKDPVVDSTDVYAFVSPDRSGTVTLIANYVPFEAPAGGPNFYEFGDDVLYAINVDNDGDGDADISYQFRFQSQLTVPTTFLYNTGPILSLTSSSWNRRQTYSVTRVDRHGAQLLGQNLPCPPCNVGPLSTPNYASLASAAVQSLGSGRAVFAGQRADGFFVDIGAIFDLADLRPLAAAHTTFGLPGVSLSSSGGVNTLATSNVQSIALQVPIGDLTRDGFAGSSTTDPRAVIGVWTSASRQRVRVFDRDDSSSLWSGPFTQLSRLGNPLVNEVLIPLSEKDYWNRQSPSDDSQFAKFVAQPELASLLNVLFPGAFPHLAAYSKPRVDLEAILLTGLPAGILPTAPLFTTSNGNVEADLLRLNVAVPPATGSPSPLGVLGGDLAGFPNGRRVTDDVVAIELQAIAGATIPLVDPTYTVDAVVPSVTDGTTAASVPSGFLSNFPYLGTPYSGFDVA
ncbi:MAG: hypothetical protein JWM85_1184 [Acidimicrobiaceae bacterium]|nr:hypothetical protein [Acidimicrobiaceae bacterium]